MIGTVALQICDIAINWAGGLHHAKKFEVRIRQHFVSLSRQFISTASGHLPMYSSMIS